MIWRPSTNAPMPASPRPGNSWLSEVAEGRSMLWLAPPIPDCVRCWRNMSSSPRSRWRRGPVGASIGADAELSRFVLGVDASYWRDLRQITDCVTAGAGTLCSSNGHRELGVPARAGFLVTPALLLFGKAGCVRDVSARCLHPAAEPVTSTASSFPDRRRVTPDSARRAMSLARALNIRWRAISMPMHNMSIRAIATVAYVTG